ncbi:hypothetical protein SAY86_011028 [Trapa natans]|uniref:EXS domain-containing protein n=1 Tax=Trapa natans TaxID=22666 RepID=A0AAN7LT70_TRANT|nr:hypothetical protein SAY86_011028 [Trapa natans]
MYGCNLFMWRSTRINYNFIFEFSSSTSLKYRDAFLICTTFMTSVVSAMVVHLLLRANGFSNSQVDAIPGILLMIFIAILVCPVDIFYRPTRYCFLRVMRNLICSPFYKVLTVDFFMAEQLTSQIPLMRHMESTACYFLARSFRTHQYEICRSGRNYREIVYVISFLLYYWRAMQCARRWFDEGDMNHLANMGKYISAIVLITSVIATIYQLYLDFPKDWGFLNPKSKNPWLRDDLILKKKGIYYFSIALNMVMRVAWVETVMKLHIGGIESKVARLLCGFLGGDSPRPLEFLQDFNLQNWISVIRGGAARPLVGREQCNGMNASANMIVQTMKYGINVPKGVAVSSAEEIRKNIQSVFPNEKELVVKSQILAGGRGLGTFKDGLKGGVHIAKVDEVENIAGPQGKVVSKFYLCEKLSLVNEMYFAITLDRKTAGPVSLVLFFCSMVKSITGDTFYFKFSFSLLDATSLIFSTIQINPIAQTSDNELIAADAKLNFDDNAAFRQKEIFSLRDPTQEDLREVAAAKADLNYIGLDGERGCMVNGVGLAMATMDIIKLHGGSPANFLDVGGNASEG